MKCKKSASHQCKPNAQTGLDEGRLGLGLGNWESWTTTDGRIRQVGVRVKLLKPECKGKSDMTGLTSCQSKSHRGLGLGLGLGRERQNKVLQYVHPDAKAS
jgi:hypothetical protein